MAQARKHVMSNTKFTRDQIVFNLEGQQGAYITAYAGAHLVAPAYEGHDGDPCWGAPEEWRDVFIEPPTVKLQAKVDELDKLVTEKRAELKRVNEELDQAGRRRQEQLKKIGQHRALQRIEDYLDGKFTHFLEVPGYSAPTIVTADKALARGGDGSWDKSLRLLTLFGDTKGDLQWRINRYSDGSGSSNIEVFPCHNEEEAIAIVRQLYTDAVAVWREQDMKHYGRAIEWSTKCPEGWVTVPDDIREYLANAKQQARQAELEKARENLAKAEAALKELS
jgi:hypothetical protein